MSRAKMSNEDDSKAYDKVLATWRRKVYQLMLERATRSEESSALRVERERMSALEANAAMERERAEKAREELAKLSERSQGDVDELRKFRDDVRVAAEKASRDLCASFSGEPALLAAAGRADEETARLERCRDRLGTLSKLLARKEVKLRNAAAATAADRRMWARERREAEMVAVAANTSSIVVDSCEDETTAMPVLRPEAEALMRSIFCDLDEKGRGVASRKALSDALRKDERLGKLMSHWVGRRAWDRALDTIDERAGFPHELDDDGAKRRQELTWGEFLLLFVVHGEETTAAPAVLEAGLRISLPPSQSPEENGEAMNLDRLGMSALREETLRLARDRAALMRALASAEREAQRARDQAALVWRHETASSKFKIEQLERDLRLEKKEKLDLEASLAATRAQLESDAARHQSILEGERREARLEIAAKDNEIVAVTNRAAKSTEAADAKIGHLQASLSAAERDRDAALAEARALDRDLKTLDGQMRAREADFEKSRREDLKVSEERVNAVKKERDGLLRILRENRLGTGKTRYHPVEDDNSRRRIDTLRAITDDLLDDDDDALF